MQQLYHRGHAHTLHRALKRRAPAGIAAFVALLALCLFATPALADDGAAPTPGDFWSAWSWDPLVLVGIAFAAWLYLRGLRGLWARAGQGRGLGVGRVALFFAGLSVVFIALISPVDAVSDVLFSVHMGQHMLLMEVAAPLLVLGLPQTAYLWALPRDARRELARHWRHAARVRRGWAILSQPLVATAVFVVALWLWHAPALYDAALRYDAVHALEHVCFLGAALLFWWRMLPTPGRPRARAGGGVLGLFAAGTLNGLLAALLIFSTAVWYTPYAPHEATWGLTPMSDQQLAGLVMWIPMGAIHAAAALSLVVIWLRAIEERAQAREHGVLVGVPESAAIGPINPDVGTQSV